MLADDTHPLHKRQEHISTIKVFSKLAASYYKTNIATFSAKSHARKQTICQHSA